MPKPTPIGQRPTKILIVAGEASGDILAADLMRALNRQQKNLLFYGVGGPAMKRAGLKPLGSIGVFPGMGLAFLAALPAIFALLGKLADWAKLHRPALCITVDNQEFSARLAKKVAAMGIPCVQYVAPKVWAWRQGRVRGLRKVFRHMLCLFPFEASFFNQNQLPATYVGHPVVERMKAYARYTLHPKPYTLLLCPGSRRSELLHHWPLFLATFRTLKRRFPALTGTVALTDAKALAFCRRHGWNAALRPAVGEARFAAMAASSAALTKSGTNNLELALLRVPAVVAYRGPAFTMWLARLLVRVPFVSPPNLVLGRPVYPEFIQEKATVESLSAAVGRLLASPALQKAQVAQLARVAGQLSRSASAAYLAAQAVLPFLSPNPLKKRRNAPQ